MACGLDLIHTQIINVDDNTVAFAQWGLGTMGFPEATEELPDTVVSKKSRHSTAAAPPSAGKTPGAHLQAGTAGGLGPW